MTAAGRNLGICVCVIQWWNGTLSKRILSASHSIAITSEKCCVTIHFCWMIGAKRLPSLSSYLSIYSIYSIYLSTVSTVSIYLQYLCIYSIYLSTVSIYLQYLSMYSTILWVSILGPLPSFGETSSSFL